MSEKVKPHISLVREIYEKGTEKAKKKGISFSAYLSVLIAEDTTPKNKEKRK